MTVQRYRFFDCISEAYEDDEGDFVSFGDYEAMCQQVKAAWQEHFLLSRENDRLKEKIREAGLGVVYQD